jgi:hypothetical protein
MVKKKPRVDDSFVLFDVIYEDGTRSSRRKVAASDLADSDGDDHAKTLIMAQDREIARSPAISAEPSNPSRAHPLKGH